MGWFLAAWTRRGLLTAGLLFAVFAPAALCASPDGSTATYVLRGTLAQYIAPGASVVGSVTVNVTSANRQRDALAGMRLTLGVDGRTKVSAPRGAIKAGAAVLVVVRGPADEPASLRGRSALEVVLQGGGDKSASSHGKKPTKEDSDATSHGDGKAADKGRGDKSDTDKDASDKSNADKGAGDGGHSTDKGGGDTKSDSSDKSSGHH